METHALAKNGFLSVARASSWCSRRVRSATCNPVLDLDPPPDRPDPSIYSQAPLLAAGTGATWDNPDIVLYTKPQLVSGTWTGRDIKETALVTVRNNSATVAAINTVVAVSYTSFGIGMERVPLTTQLISLAPREARQLSIPMPQDRPPESLSLFVELSHPYDSDLTNNQGASSTAIVRYPAGVSELLVPQVFTLGNVTADPITYNLSVQPNTLGVTLSSAQVTVAPGSTDIVRATHGSLSAPPGNTSFTVVATDARGNLAGGCTWLLYFG